ncbi:MAG: CHAT domain-containing protein [Cytophagales bacterium]|nr:CHAT domain-containing protein [Cytophagales bacterium]
MRHFLLIFLLVGMMFHAPAQGLISRRIFILIKTENFDKAIRFGEKKLAKLERKNKVHKRGIPYLLGLGMAYEKWGDWKKAEEYFHRAYELVYTKQQKGKKLKIIECDVLDEVALFYINAGNLTLSKRIIQESKQARKRKFRKTNPLRFRYYLPLGLYHYKKNDLDSSFHYLKKYILYLKNSNHTQKLETNRMANAYEIIAKIEFNRNNFQNSLKYAKKNKRYQNHPWTLSKAGKNNIKRIQAYNLLAQNYRILEKHKKAKRCNKRALKIYRKNIERDTYHKVPLLTTEALIAWDLGELDIAKTYLLEACQLQLSFIQHTMTSLTEKEKENFYQGLRNTFDLLYAFGVDYEIDNPQKKQAFIEKVYNYQLQTKGIILNETNKLYQVIHSSQDSTLQAEYKEWVYTKNQLAQLLTAQEFKKVKEQVDSLTVHIEQLEKKLTKKANIQTNQTTDWQHIQKSLKKDEVAIELIRVKKYDTLSFVYTKRKKKIKHTYKALTDSIIYLALGVHQDSKHPLCEIIHNGRTLEDEFIAYYYNCTLYEIEDTISYYQYWKPLESIIQDKKTVYLSADGIYNLLNLGTIKTPNKSYLVDSLKIINVSNTYRLTEKKKKQPLENATLIGRPSFHYQQENATRGSLFRAQISDLPATEQEVKKIATLLEQKGIESNILIQEQATEQAIKSLSSSSILHIATHGFFQDVDNGQSAMLRAGLLLSPNSNSAEDGILTAYEASGLNLQKTNIVVLSACVTGQGEIKHGEGVYGLQRAFEVAGVPYILISLWNVDDKATQELMVLFYQNLLEEQDVHIAYKKALQTLRLQYPNPFYWGAFKLLGK